VRKYCLLSVLIGVMIFLVFFRLLGGAPQSIGVPKANLLLDGKTLWSIASGMFGAITTFSIAWFNSNIRTTHTEIRSTLEIFQIKNEQSHEMINKTMENLGCQVVTVSTDVNKISQDVNAITFIKDQKANYRKKMLQIQEDYVKIIDTFENGNLRDFTIVKTKMFRDFVMNTHDLGFQGADLDPHCIKTAGMSLAGEMRRKSRVMLPESFVEAYYFYHLQAASEYCDQVIRILSDQDNSKHERFQEISENFMKEFLSALIKTHVDSLKENKPK